MKKLADYAFNSFSQFGEDGIIQKIFDIIGISSKVCIEFGAWDGFHFSNTANLFTNGWKAILIEANRKRFNSLIQNVKNYDCCCLNIFVENEGTFSLENILKKHNLLGETDLLSIDIDGDDYYIFKSLETLRPRVICCEYNPTIPVYMDLVPEEKNRFGCSLLSLIKLAETKGYKLVSVTDTNCLFVSAADFEKFFEYETSLTLLAITKSLTYLITDYNGNFVFSRKPAFGFKQVSRQKFTVGKYFNPSLKKMEGS